MNWFSLAFILFLIMDPVGNINSFLTLVKDLPPRQQRQVVVREMLIALFVMLLFNFIGELLFDLLQISEKTVRIASGVILFLVALKILFSAKDSPRANLPKGNPFIIPLAIPLICGPSLLATIMLFAHIIPTFPVMVTAIFAAWLAASLVLYFAPELQKILRNNGLIALERLMGMVLILLAIQRFLEGLQQFVAACRLT